MLWILLECLSHHTIWISEAALALRHRLGHNVIRRRHLIAILLLHHLHLCCLNLWVVLKEFLLLDFLHLILLVQILCVIMFVAQGPCIWTLLPVKLVHLRLGVITSHKVVASLPCVQIWVLGCTWQGYVAIDIDGLLLLHVVSMLTLSLILDRLV